ncbi:hypothetical protein CFter6_1686 [Collimonas fungivorans]|uniref:Uncharacterized protein n=1 Tax=Collimonas fungivorans TaxID=158899 RepID=A0A127P9F5_9BURK|nr:hypothetical protein [Collimonas fungivorans]AMO94388.1 hypothetical protein CFter6_1686 [Collimonas fungivorans]
MESEVFFVKSFDKNKDINTFFKELNRSGLNNEYLVCRMNPTNIGDYLREYYVKHGISSLFHYSLACDAVLHAGIHVDEIENIVVEFLSSLKGVRNLLIIDPYFFKCAADIASLELFKRIVAEISENLEKVTFITNGSGMVGKSNVFDALKSVKSSVEVSDVKTDEFHDRFWIDPDTNKGIVMGTSLNGIGKKIALVDKLQNHDVKEILRLARQIIGAGT